MKTKTPEIMKAFVALEKARAEVQVADARKAAALTAMKKACTNLQKAAAKAMGVNAMLSTRQQQVLKMLSHGASNKEIASALNISVRTTKFHVSKLFLKTGLTNRRDFWMLSPNEVMVKVPGESFSQTGVIQ